MTNLPTFHAHIAARVEAIVDAAPDWPCRRGCDGCCHALADVPQLREAEWVLLRNAIAALPADVRALVETRVAALATATRPFTCPLLDDTGACRVYAARPLACRTYGFYRARDGGRWCATIEASGGADTVVTGNHDTLEAEASAALGPTQNLLSWWYRVGVTAPP